LTSSKNIGSIQANSICRRAERSWHLVARLGTLVLLVGCLPAAAQLSSYAVLAGSTVTNTATPTMVTGNLGVSPGTSVTGFPPGVVVSGSIHSADASAGEAQSELTALYGTLASTACNTDLTGQDLGGKTLTPGVYCFSTSAQLTGTLTLDAQGNPDATFTFKIGSTLTTASGSTVLLINNASSCSVFWQVGSSATLGTGTALAGSIVALSSITLNTSSSITGRILARNGAVTLDDNQVTLCSGGAGLPPIALAAIPTLSESAMILLAGFLAVIGLTVLRRRATQRLC
jgi:Ice-binding-like/IPTL-CTERM motif